MAIFRKIGQCFKKCNQIRAKHLLWEDFKKERTDITGRGLEKIAFYVWLDRNELKADFGKDESGDFGYGLEYIPNINNK